MSMREYKAIKSVESMKKHIGVKEVCVLMIILSGVGIILTEQTGMSGLSNLMIGCLSSSIVTLFADIVESTKQREERELDLRVILGDMHGIVTSLNLELLEDKLMVIQLSINSDDRVLEQDKEQMLRTVRKSNKIIGELRSSVTKAYGYVGALRRLRLNLRKYVDIVDSNSKINKDGTSIETVYNDIGELVELLDFLILECARVNGNFINAEKILESDRPLVGGIEDALVKIKQGSVGVDDRLYPKLTECRGVVDKLQGAISRLDNGFENRDKIRAG